MDKQFECLCVTESNNHHGQIDLTRQENHHFSFASSSTVHGNHFPITFAQSIFRYRYNIIPSTIALITPPITKYAGLVESDPRLSMNGLPKKTAPNTIISFRTNFPRKVAIANFQGLY